jgi:predicted dehydrogenase
MKNKTLYRRTFIRTTGTSLIGAGVAPTLIPSSAFGGSGRPAPNDRIVMGIIGTGNQGTNDMKKFLSDERVQVVAVCDVNRRSPGYWDGAVAGRQVAKEIVELHYGETQPSGSYSGCDEYEDFRSLLARDDIDAVEVATPDHWHAIQAIAAAKAGKDVYCQKPLSLSIVEGRAMSNAVTRYQRVFQTGSQQRSGARFRQDCGLV